MFFESLTQSHSRKLLEFELENREFFESSIAPRTTGFYTGIGISKHIDDLLLLKDQSLAYPYVLVNDESIIARANIKEIKKNGVGEIGYRVCKQFTGKGIGSLCVSYLVSISINLDLKQLMAFVINNNKPSEKVLLNNNFRLNLCIPNGFFHQGKSHHGFKYVRVLI
jgi:ribosomal-protein-alanine N-acetyltransferase